MFKSFIDLVLAGDALISEIEEYIEKWHKADSEKTVYAFLGMSEYEYALWVENSAFLKAIINAKKNNRNVIDEICTDDLMAARTQDYSSLRKWLIDTGRIEK